MNLGCLLMKDKILYLDCDGVILDTIDEAYRMMRELNMDISDWRVVNNFFVNIDWNILIYEAGILKHSITKIKRIIESGMFKEVKILTKTSGNLEEAKIKKILFGKLLPEIEVITVDFYDNKDEVVDPVGHILVDDSKSNCRRWSASGGRGILFVREKPNYELDQIDDLIDVPKVLSLKKL